MGLGEDKRLEHRKDVGLVGDRSESLIPIVEVARGPGARKI